MSLLVHGVVAAGASASPVDGTQLVVHRDVAAVVRDCDDDRDTLPSRKNLLEHARVLEQYTEQTTVLPMRFGMVTPDAQQLVADYLEPQHDVLVAGLDRLEGQVELRLRGSYDEPTVLRELAADDPVLVRLRGRDDMESRLQLGERVVAGLDQRRARDVEHVVATLQPHVAGLVEQPVAEPLDAFSLSLLVARDDAGGFDAAVDQLGADLAPALALELVGPLPPFSFATTEAVGT